MGTDLYLRPDVADFLAGADPFKVLPAQPGDTYRSVAQRQTRRVVLGERAYFLKHHQGVGWGEIAKNLSTLRWPVVSARNEFEACQALAAAGMRAPVVAAFGERNANPAARESFVLTDEITGHTTLEDLAAGPPLLPLQQRRLVTAVADFTRRFHDLGMIHRDYYICHLWLEDGTLDSQPTLTVIDLHRARRFDRIPTRWLVRDLAALLFSVMHLPLAPASWLRFVRLYRQQPLAVTFASEAPLWRAVYERAQKLYAKDHGSAHGMEWPW
ncbi:MAG: lipopolysaccharide core heptose(I) kinase RfaP [Pseudomonadales bacterium]